MAAVEDVSANPSPNGPLSDERAAGFDVARTGVASVGFIGFPSVGKSTLMSKLTGQHSEGMSYGLERVLPWC